MSDNSLGMFGDGVMAVRKIGKRYFPVGKKGKAWKNGFATEAKAKAALTKANKYWGTKKTTKPKAPKKKTSKKKKSGGKKVANAKTYVKNQMTPSNIAKIYALSGSGIHHGLILATDKYGQDPEYVMKRALATYTGYDMTSNEFALDELVRGYAGVGNDIAWRKFAKAMGFQAYPRSKPKNLSQFLDYLCMYGSPAVKAYANMDDPVQANIEVYKALNGVDLGQVGISSYQPAAMLETKGVYALKKMIFKFAREAGYAI